MGSCYGISQDLADLLGNKLRPRLSLGQLFWDARLRFPSLWIRRYGYSRLDTSGISRVLEMAHRVHLLRSRIWKTRANVANNQQMHAYCLSFIEELLGFQVVSLFHRVRKERKKKKENDPKTPQISSYWYLLPLIL